MKATLEFNLPEERTEFRHAVSAGDMICVLSDVDEYLRQRIKHGDDPEDVRAALLATRDELRRSCQERGIDPWAE